MIQKLLSYFFTLEILGETYLHRWILAENEKRCWYLHHYVGSDWARDMHDHPKTFLSIGLWGDYIERTPDCARFYSAPWVRRFVPEHTHRITMRNGATCWTLCRVGPKVRGWGFHTKNGWVLAADYVKVKNQLLTRQEPTSETHRYR